MYINPETGQEYTYEQLVGLAGSVDLVQEYIANNGLIELSDVQEEDQPVIEEVDFQEVTAPEADASVVADVPVASENMDLDLENISLASATDLFDEDPFAKLKKAQKELDRFNAEVFDPNNSRSRTIGLPERKRLEAIVKAAEREIENAPIDLKLPETIIKKGIKEVLSFFQSDEGLPNIAFENKSNIFNNKIEANLGGEIVTLDLNPLTEKGEKEFYENYNKVIEYDKVVKARNAEGQGAFSNIINSFDNGIIPYEDINSSLENTGYNFEPIIKDGLTVGYALKKDGKTVAEDSLINAELVASGEVVVSPSLRQNEKIQNYIVENFTNEEVSKTYEFLYPLLETHLKTLQVEEDKRFNAIDSTPDGEMFDYDVLTGTFNKMSEILKNKEYFTELETQAIDYMLQTVANPEGRGEYVDSGSMLTEDEFVELTPDQQLEYVRSLSFLDNMQFARDGVQVDNATLKEKLLNGNVWNNAIDSVIKYKRKEAKTLAKQTAAESIMYNYNRRDRELVRIGSLMQAAGFDKINDELEADKKVIENYNKTISLTISSQMTAIADMLKDVPSKIGYTKTTGIDDVLYFNLEKDGELTPEQKEVFDEASVRLFNLQNTLGRLENDYEKTIQNYINHVAEITSYKEGISVVVGEDEKGKDITRNILQGYENIFKEYDVGSLIAKDFTDATYGIALSIPTLFNSEWAINEQKALQRKENYYKSSLKYDDAFGEGEFGLYSLRTLFQQAPNILMAIGTGYAGAGIGLSSSATKWSIASTFGVSSGTDMYRNLSIQTDLVEIAENNVELLNRMWNAGRIDAFSYSQGLVDAEKTIAMGDMTPTEIGAAAIATGIIEGGITRWIGTADNTLRFIKDVKGTGTTNIYNLFAKPKLNAWGGFIGEAGTRIRNEVIEEELIYGLTQGISETAILNRDADWSQFDDTALATIITAGFANTSGVAYSALLNMNATSKFRENVNKHTVEIDELVTLMNSENVTEAQRREVFIPALKQKLLDLGLESNSLAIDVIANGAENTSTLVGLEILKKDLYNQAGVVPGMTTEQINNQIDNYKANELTTDEANRFDSNLNSVNTNISSIVNGKKNYKKAEELLGKAGKKARLNLDENTPGWNGNLDTRQELGVVVEEMHRMQRESFVNKAKKDPETQAKWEKAKNEISSKYEGDKRKKDYKRQLEKYKDVFFEMQGKELFDLDTRIFTTSVGIDTKASQLMSNENIGNLEFIEIENVDDQINYLYTLSENGLIKPSTMSKFVESLEQEGSFGFIVENQYIARNVDEARSAMGNGDVRAGVTVYHEFGHAIDDSYFETVEDFNVYAENLYEAASTSTNADLKGLHHEVENALINSEAYGKYAKDSNGKIIPFNERSDIYKDEYTKELQSLSYFFEKELQLEENFGTETLFSKIKNRFGKGLDVNTKDKALRYMIGNNAAFRKGELTSQVRQKIDKTGIVERTGSAKKSVQISDRINKKFEGKENFKPVSASEVETMVNKVANRAWTRFGSRVPKNISEQHYDRKRYKDHAISKLREIALKWDPNLATFDSYMANRGMQRANAFANELGVPKGKANVRIGEDKSTEKIAASETSESLKQRAREEAKEVTPSLTSRIKFKNNTEVESKIEKQLEKEIKYRLPKYNADTTTKQKTDFVKELGKGMQLSFKSVIDAMGARNKTVNEYEQFLNDNYTTLLGPNGLTTTYLSKAFPQAVEKYVNGMGWVKYDKWKGRTKGSKKGQIDFYRSTELGPMAGSTAGNQKIRRVKDIKNAIPLAKFKSKYIKLTTNAKGEQVLTIPQMPTEALSKQIAQEIGLDIFNRNIQQEDSQIRKDFVERQEFFGADILDNYVEQLMYDVSRPSVKNQLALFDNNKRTNWLSKRFSFYDEVRKLNTQALSSTQLTNKIKSIHKGVYGDTFLEEEHLGVAKQFGRLLTPQRKTGVINQDSLEYTEYLEQIVLSVDTIQNINSFVKGADQTVAESLRSMDNMVEARDFVEKNLYPALVKRYGKEKALDLMVAFTPASLSNGMSVFGDFIATENNELIGNQRPNKTPRAGIFGNMQDITRLIQRIDPTVASIDRKVIKFNDGKPDRKVDINTSADVLMQYVNGKFENSKELQDKNKADADLAWNYFIDFMQTLKSSNISPNTTAMLLGVMNGSNNSALRLAAPVWGRSTKMPYDTLKIPKVRNGKVEKNKKGETVYEPAYRYEHAVPARVVLFLTYEAIFNNNKNIDLNLLKDDYRVTIIPVKEVDDVIGDSGFSQSMLVNYLPGKAEWWKRYFNIFTKGKMPFALQSYADSKNKVGVEFEEFYNLTNGTKGVDLNAQQVISQNNNTDIAMQNARNSVKYSKKIKKIRVFDFDDTLARSNSKVIVVNKDGSTYKINATQFAKDAARLESEGAVFDFTEFNKVVEGKKGPLFEVAKTIQEKRGSEDIFVLTARPQEAARPIQEFLASIGLNIPIQNITGLADGKAEAKANWMINKFAEGYNDFYFTDDATKNVDAVKAALDVLDVKSKVQIARVKFQKDLNFEFNKMIERNKGIKAEARFSQVVAQRLGRNKKRFALFLPPSAEDFSGLTKYVFAGKGKQGDLDQEFFDKSLIRPYVAGVAAIEKARQRVSNDYTALLQNFPKIGRVLRGKIPGEEFTFDEAVRVYLWDQAGFEIPGISKRDQNLLSKIVREDPNLQSFADGVLLITKKDTYVDPPAEWQAQTILGDLNTITTKVNRSEYIAEFIENVDIIFSQENLTKVEAVYGSRVKESLENMIYRMKQGTNRPKGTDRQTAIWMNWINRSVGAIMFLNRRSAVLQLISNINFINWSDNNVLKAGAAFANQKQYWSDVSYIFNSDKLKQRRAGLKGDINEAEIAAAVKGSKNKMGAFISILLRKGFVFTQIADSVAIATGGATFYRNRINTYKKQGMSQAEAEAKAFEDFSRVSEESQQSADPMMISQQQAGMLGRFLLNFQNTPMQYTRLMKKAGSDIINGRGDLKTNISKIVYYGFIQNLIFSTLQNALFAMIPGFDEPDDELSEEEQIEKYGKVLSKKQDRVVNGMIDTVLRGSGVGGAVISTIKNAVRRYNYEEGKGFGSDHTYTMLELANLSPAIGSKLRKVYSAIQTNKFEKDVIAEQGFSVTIDGKFQLSPAYQVVGSLVSGVGNVPLDRLVAEINGLTEAMDNRNTAWQRVALALGWRTWDVNSKFEEFDLIKVEGKKRRKEEGKIKAKETRRRNAEKKRKERELEEERYNKMSDAQKLEYDLKQDKILQKKVDEAMEEAMKKLDKLYE